MRVSKRGGLNSIFTCAILVSFRSTLFCFLWSEIEYCNLQLLCQIIGRFFKIVRYRASISVVTFTLNGFARLTQYAAANRKLVSSTRISFSVLVRSLSFKSSFELYETRLLIKMYAVGVTQIQVKRMFLGSFRWIWISFCVIAGSSHT